MFSRFCCSHPLKLISFFSFGLPLPLTEKPDSPRLVLVRPGIFNPSNFTIQDAMRVTTMMLDFMLNEDDNFVIAGQIGILDLSGVTVQHFLQFNPTFIKKMTVLTQDAAPGRQKGLHWINTPRGFEQVFNVFTGFMNEKNRSRVRNFFIVRCILS
jgi:CRAL/TRIO domain